VAGFNHHFGFNKREITTVWAGERSTFDAEEYLNRRCSMRLSVLRDKKAISEDIFREQCLPRPLLPYNGYLAPEISVTSLTGMLFSRSVTDEISCCRPKELRCNCRNLFFAVKGCSNNTDTGTE